MNWIPWSFPPNLSCLSYSWKLHLKRNVEYIVSKDIGSALENFLWKSGAVTTLKVFSVKADFFNWRTQTISLLLVTHLIARLLKWILEWLCSRHFRKQTSNSKVSWVQEGQEEGERQEESHLKEKAGGKKPAQEGRQEENARRERGRELYGKWAIIRKHVLVPVSLLLAIQIEAFQLLL